MMKAFKIMKYLLSKEIMYENKNIQIKKSIFQLLKYLQKDTSRNSYQDSYVINNSYVDVDEENPD